MVVIVAQQCECTILNATELYTQKWWRRQILFCLFMLFIFYYKNKIYIRRKNQAEIHERLSQRHADHPFVQIRQVRPLTSYRPT